MIIYYIPPHKRQCLVTIIFTNLPSLLPLSFHEMIFILVRESVDSLSRDGTDAQEMRRT